MLPKNFNLQLRNKIFGGGRIAPEEALELFSWDIIELGKAADMRRKIAFPKEEVGFIIDRIVNFTNICEAACAFCAFHARANQIYSYELTIEDICRKVEELVQAGGTQVMLQGGLHPDYTLDTYKKMIKEIKTRFPEVYLHSLSPSEIVHISRKSALSINNVVKTLKEAGLDSVPGASDLLVDRIRKKISPKKISVDEWCEVLYTLYHNNMKSSATMTYGMGETDEEKIEHLAVIRDIQDRTGILRAFIPWSFSPANTRLENIQPATGIEYLKVVAIARIFLDNITYIQAGWLTEGLKLAQIALTMGANDMGGVLMEEVVVKATGIKTKTNRRELVGIIKNAGKIPVQRDSEYRVTRIFHDNA
ncbi:MAG: CofH family radical SAM protein [Deltaproteobacteria bacterium]|nr:CofH family radical SAM protein [Deltaproteobacteria bacterium]